MRLRIPQHVVFEILDGQAVLLDVRGGNYFSLNPSATRMWELIEEHHDGVKVKEQMLAEFQVDEASLERDFASLIENLEARGLIEVESPEPQ